MTIWFSKKPEPEDPDDKARYYLDYMDSIVEQPEKWSVVNKLYDLIREYDFPKDITLRILQHDIRRLNVTLSMFGDTDTIDYILTSDHLTPWMVSGIINNKSVTVKQLHKCLEISGDHPREKTNKQLINLKLEKLERNARNS